jgi:hypothetical protein
MAERAHGRRRRWVTATVGLVFMPLASAVALLSLNTLGSRFGTSSNPIVVLGILLLTILAIVLWARVRHLTWARTAGFTFLALVATSLLAGALLGVALEAGCSNGYCSG